MLTLQSLSVTFISCSFSWVIFIVSSLVSISYVMKHIGRFKKFIPGSAWWRSKAYTYAQHCAIIVQWSIFYIGIYSINLYTFRYYSINVCLLLNSYIRSIYLKIYLYWIAQLFRSPPTSVNELFALVLSRKTSKNIHNYFYVKSKVWLS